MSAARCPCPPSLVAFAALASLALGVLSCGDDGAISRDDVAAAPADANQAAIADGAASGGGEGTPGLSDARPANDTFDSGRFRDTASADPGAGPIDAGPAADATPPADPGAPTDTGVASGPADLNAGFIGGACIFDWECQYDDPFCVVEPYGFKAGLCSQFCDRFCPDRDGHAQTFCADPDSIGLGAPRGLCLMQCDTDRSPMGCRDGYQCVNARRFNEAATERAVCAPVPQPRPPAPPPCLQELERLGVAFEPASNPRDSPPGRPDLVCDIDDPVRLQPVLNGVTLRYDSLSREPTALFLSCPMALALVEMTRRLAADGVTDVVHLGTYNCRLIAGTDNISQHGLANAFDIASLRLSDGTVYSVLDDWERYRLQPSTPGGRFLRRFAEGIYRDWVVHYVLTPDFNDAHLDHLHVDLTPGSYLFR